MPHQPRKRFGQNFLQDSGVIADILAALNPSSGEKIVEIGPGLGALTLPLLAAVNHLDAIEIDRDLAAALQEELAPRLTLHLCDVLNFDFHALGSDLRIVGNLPYNISTPLLFHLATFADDLRDIQAGKAAGMPTIAAAWGYCGHTEPTDWLADIIATHPLDLVTLLKHP